MSKSTNELVKKITNKKEKSFVERAAKTLDKEVTPYIGIGIMVACTVDSLSTRVRQVPHVPSYWYSAIIVVTTAFVFSRAFRLFKKK